MSLTPAQAARYARHLTLPQIGAAGQARLSAGRVLVVGAGGLGSPAAFYLAAAGVGRIGIMDGDVVEPSNLNRQQYFTDQIGLPKTEALRANLHRINPYVALEPAQVRLTPENVPVVFRDVQVLVEAFDRAEEKAMLVESFTAAYPDRPVVVASGLAGHGPNNTVRTRMLGRRIVVVGDESSEAAPGMGLMAPRVGIAAHHQANAVLRLLLGEAPA